MNDTPVRPAGIHSRKDDHLRLCAEEDVEHRRGTLLDDVHLLHDALPELAVSEVDLSCELFGRTVQAPLLFSGMSGGTPRAGELNRALAGAAQKFGLAMGVGSQRVMRVDPATADTFRLRDVAPDVPLLANLGAVQARDAGVAAVAELVEAIGADALCIHLNPAQELVQDEGDRDFRGCLEAIGRLAAELGVPVVAKETGCGLSPVALEKLSAAGVRWVDVSGAGGTSWTAIEGLRGSERQRALGESLREWGIPTAASVVFARRAGMRVIASGGLRDGRDVARALALGADAGAIALPLLRAFAQGGSAGLLTAVARLLETLRSVAVLLGASSLADLRGAPCVIGPELSAWLAAAPPRR